MNGAWKEAFAELLTQQINEDRYLMLPTADGPVVKCEPCGKRITEPEERFTSIMDEVLEHERLMH